MDDKKQIEEMAKDLCSEYHEDCICCCGSSHTCTVCEDCERLYNAGYRKIPEGAVVLTREEYEERENKINEQCQTRAVKVYTDFLKVERDKARKETAREILYKVKETLIINNEENTEFFDYNYTLETIDEIAKQYGVEV